MQNRLLIILLAIIISGCTTVLGNKVFLDRYTQLKKGVSTRQDAINILGTPTQIDRPTENTERLIYEKRTIRKEGYLNQIEKVDTERLTVFIDNHDVVTDYKLDEISDEQEVYAQSSGGSHYQPAVYTPPPHMNGY